MGAGHTHPLYRDGHSAVHRLNPEVKIVALVAFVLAVIATPREVVWPYGIYALILLAVWRIAGIGIGWMAPRMLIEVPFVVLAVLLPFGAGSDRVDVAGLSLSVAGLYAAWGIVAKGTLGVAASLTVAATTSARTLPLALSRLRVPATITSILVLMIRYLDVLAGEANRMRLARISRGDSPRALHQAGAIAKSAGALFVRSYERGEAVHLAMLSRGYRGRVPDLALGPYPALGSGGAALAPAHHWILAMVAPAAAAVVALSAWLLR